MNHDNDFDGMDEGGFGGGDPLGLKRRRSKRLPPFMQDVNFSFDYKDPQKLRLFITERGKIVPRRVSGLSARQQRDLALSVKRAQNIALLPYTKGDV